MANQNARIIEKNIFEGMSAANVGDSEIVDLWNQGGGPNKYSCQAIYDVVSQSARIVPSSDIVPGDGEDESIFEFTAHGYVTGVKVQLTTSDTLPAPLQLATDYFVIVLDANTFRLAATLADAFEGVYIELDDAGVGNQTVTPVAIAGASVTFQESNDGTNWTNVQNATSITVDGNVVIKQIAYLRYFKAVKALTAGVVDLSALLLVIGDAE